MKKTILIAILSCISHAIISQIAPQPEPQPIYYNTFYGYRAFYSNTTGNHNAAFGAYALYKNTTTHYNTAVGAMALYNATATGNVAVRRRALYSTTTGGSNVAVGMNALVNNVNGLANVAIGPDETEVRMDLPETTKRANVIVYNHEGKELKTIPVNARGTTAMKIARNDLSDGMYLYALIVDGKVIDTKRLVLTR